MSKISQMPVYTGSLSGVKVPVLLPSSPTPDGDAVDLGRMFLTENLTLEFKTVATYALMIAEGTPTVATLYEVIADEDKSYTRTTYLWKPSGRREWLASTPDN